MSTEDYFFFFGWFRRISPSALWYAVWIERGALAWPWPGTRHTTYGRSFFVGTRPSAPGRPRATCSGRVP